MSIPPSHDPRPADRVPGQPLTDEQILHVHEHTADDKTDDRGSYRLLPLFLLFFFSGLIFYAGTYLNMFSGDFDPRIHNEHAKPKEVAAAAIDPMVFGRTQYTSLCITCHLANGEGVPGANPPLAGSEWVNGSEERLVRIVLHGLKGPVTVKGEVYNQQMPAVPWDDARIAAVLTYVRGSFGNTSGPVTPEKVAAIRAATAGHAQWTEAELKALP